MIGILEPNSDMIPERIHFLGVPFCRMPAPKAVEAVRELMRRRIGSRVYFVNANSIVIAERDNRMRTALQRADLILADGSGVLWGSALMRTPLSYNLNGTDLVPQICEAAARDGLSIYILGGKPGVAEDAARRWEAAYPGLSIVGFQHGYYEPSEGSRVLEAIQRLRPHLLVVAMGSPLQETWIDEQSKQLPGVVCLGVGGLLDFVTKRAPRGNPQPRWSIAAPGTE